MIEIAACLVWLIIIGTPLCAAGLIVERIEKDLTECKSDRP